MPCSEHNMATYWGLNPGPPGSEFDALPLGQPLPTGTLNLNHMLYEEIIEIIEPMHQKTNNLQMQNQRRRSAVQ